MGVNRYNFNKFNYALSDVLYKVFGQVRGKGYYIDNVPEVWFNISSELEAAKDFKFVKTENAKPKKKQTKFIVLSR